MPIVPEHKIDHARKLAASTSMALSEIAAVVGVSESTLRRYGLAAAASPAPPDAAVSLAPLQPQDSLNERLEKVARSELEKLQEQGVQVPHRATLRPARFLGQIENLASAREKQRYWEQQASDTDDPRSEAYYLAMAVSAGRRRVLESFIRDSWSPNPLRRLRALSTAAFSY